MPVEGTMSLAIRKAHTRDKFPLPGALTAFSTSIRFRRNAALPPADISRRHQQS
jgi:hypothetical protein